MITSDIIVVRPAAQNVAPGVSLPAGPRGLPGLDGAPGALGPPGSPGVSGANGVIQSIAGISKASIALEELPFTALGTGAVARVLTLAVQDFSVNVKLYGAKGDNSADDTAAIQAAVSFAATFSGCKIFFPAGIYLISAAITVPAGKSISFEGVGPGASIVRQTSATADGIVYDNTANNPYLTQGQHVRSLTIEAGAGLVTSGFFGQGSTGRGIVYVHGNDNSGVRDVSINGFATGLALLGSYNTLHTNFRVMFGSGDAVLIDKAADGTVGAGNRLQQVKPSNNGFTGNNSASHGIRIRASGGEYLSKIDATSFFNGMLVDPRAGDQVAYLFVDTVLCDTSTGDGAIFDGTNGNIISVAGSMFWASFGAGSGLITKGANLHGLRLTNARLRENGQYGWDHQGGDGIELHAPEIHANGRGSTAGTYSGVRIFDGATAAKSFAIIGGSGGNVESGYTAQGEFIRFLGAAANFRVEGVDMTGAGGGKPPVAYADETKLSAFRMLGNLPAATYGVNPSERIAQTVGGYLAAGATAYYEPPGPSATPNNLPFFTVRSLLAGKVYVAVNTAPGAGQTYTFQLVQNGTPVGPTGVISGASSYAVTFFPGIVLAPGDSYELQVVGSSGAAAMVARGFLQMEP